MNKNCNHSKFLRTILDTNELSEIFESLLEKLYEEGGDEHEKL